MKIEEKVNNVKLTGYRFVDHVEDKIMYNNFNLYMIYNEGYHGSLHNLLNHGYIKLMGYKYNAKDYLKKYIVKGDYGIYEYYAPNKTLLRRSIKCYTGSINYILEIKKDI